MSDDYDAEIIPFPKGQFERAHNERESALDEEPVRIERGSKKHCYHHRSMVNEYDRTLICRDCEAPLDPIHVLARLASSRESLILRGRSLRLEVDGLAASVEKLKRDEKNTKARLRNAEHPALKEARLALKEGEAAFWHVSELMLKLGIEESDSKLYQQVINAWGRCTRAANKLRPSNAATG